MHANMFKSVTRSDHLTGAVSMNSCWAIDRQGLGVLCDYLSGTDGFASVAANKIGDLQSYINSVRIYPVDIRACGDLLSDSVPTQIKAGPFPTTSAGFLLKNYMSKPIVYDIDMTSAISYNNNFLDYSPFRTYELYLPFYGVVPLEPQKFIIERSGNEHVHISAEYIINFLTGSANITLYSYIENNGVKSDYIMMFEDSCKIGEDFPWGMDNTAGKLVDMALTGVKSALSFGMGISSAVSVPPNAPAKPQAPKALAPRGRGRPSKKRLAEEEAYAKRYTQYMVKLGQYNEAMEQGGIDTSTVLDTSFSAANGLLNILSFKSAGVQGNPASGGIPFLGYDKMYLIVKNAHIHEINNYAHYVGHPVADEIKLSEHHGLCVMSRVYMEGMSGVLASELNEIEDYLLSGVILP